MKEKAKVEEIKIGEMKEKYEMNTRGKRRKNDKRK